MVTCLLFCLELEGEEDEVRQRFIGATKFPFSDERRCPSCGGVTFLLLTTFVDKTAFPSVEEDIIFCEFSEETEEGVEVGDGSPG
tara:strand:- start:290 stop:544 length:255 start_codon:yes stop_codon:yes gene_type:complete